MPMELNILQGNLCRCTGYRPILEAFATFTPAKEGGTQEVAHGSGEALATWDVAKLRELKPEDLAITEDMKTQLSGFDKVNNKRYFLMYLEVRKEENS